MTNTNDRNDRNDSPSLSDLFAAADQIGSKYATDESADIQAQIDAVNADIIREAVKRGEYDPEKQMWLV